MAIVAMVAAMVPMSGPTLALSPVTTGPPPECYSSVLLSCAVVGRQVTADPVISAQVSHSTESPWSLGGHLVPLVALKH